MEKRFHELEGIIAKAKQQVVQQDEEVSPFSIRIVVVVAHCSIYPVRSKLLN